MSDHHISVVVLNYNSAEDLECCITDICKQKYLYYTIIIVDNASSGKDLSRIKRWLSTWHGNLIEGGGEYVKEWVSRNKMLARQPSTLLFVENNKNNGYSAGNNVGIKIAESINSDAILIANPDMRFPDEHYIETLARQTLCNDDVFVSGSRIIDLDGEDINPIRESTFWEELLWPKYYFRIFQSAPNYVSPFTSGDPVYVQKISGCCLMIRMNFLKATNYLDENVFLYCEEPILAARTRRLGGKILFVPEVKAIHAHKSNMKSAASVRMVEFIKSRKYYLDNYSDYNSMQLFLLKYSYFALNLIWRARDVVFRHIHHVSQLFVK